jgi:hypothetical protein
MKNEVDATKVSGFKGSRVKGFEQMKSFNP